MSAFPPASPPPIASPPTPTSRPRSASGSSLSPSRIPVRTGSPSPRYSPKTVPFATSNLRKTSLPTEDLAVTLSNASARKSAVDLDSAAVRVGVSPYSSLPTNLASLTARPNPVDARPVVAAHMATSEARKSHLVYFQPQQVMVAPRAERPVLPWLDDDPPAPAEAPSTTSSVVPNLPGLPNPIPKFSAQPATSNRHSAPISPTTVTFQPPPPTAKPEAAVNFDRAPSNPTPTNHTPTNHTPANHTPANRAPANHASSNPKALGRTFTLRIREALAIKAQRAPGPADSEHVRIMYPPHMVLDIPQDNLGGEIDSEFDKLFETIGAAPLDSFKPGGAHGTATVQAPGSPADGSASDVIAVSPIDLSAKKPADPAKMVKQPWITRFFGRGAAQEGRTTSM